MDRHGQTDAGHEEATPSPRPFRLGWRVYAIVGGLGIANLLAALENTVLTVAAPEVLSDLQLGDDYVWITNAFFLASTALQPLFGQFCDVFGRRHVLFTVIGLFVLGSGICGGAQSGAMLIAGRAIQGAGSGGIMLVSSIVLSDLVPLRQRGNVSAILMSIIGIGSAVGPVIGGAIASSTTWRWIFYLNLPIGAAAVVVLFFLLHMNYNKDMTFRQKLKRIDFAGNAILVASSVAILYALSYADTRYPWRSWHTLVPLLVGCAGLLLFGYLQTIAGRSRLSPAAEPLVPPRFFNNRTSVILAVTTFVSSALLYWSLFFLPVFFQAVKLYTPLHTGVALLPIGLVGIPGSVVGAVALSRWGRYKPIHMLAFALQTTGLGLLTLQGQDTTVAEWAVYQCVLALGGGIIFTTMLPAFQAFVAERDLARATATWYFIRLFGHVWGVAIPAAIFNQYIASLLDGGSSSSSSAAVTISDPVARAALADGGAYQAASAAFVEQFAPAVQAEIREVYRLALRRIFQVGIGFAGLAFVLSLFEHEIPLRSTLETEYGLKEDVAGGEKGQRAVERLCEEGQRARPGS
ncbi:major facilitator superfamily domain-containing protein [Coniella lustricola]|uniref:Major facilitator superfamily domain-containing protein n=1 Tax=Coniella lustricola TaxID=2025994 RepID=A0A2T3A0I6_9PEZI|nr:major facilitator superfamily domain-containing protein [Coniella lustricola]